MERLVFRKWKFQVVVWIKEGIRLRLSLEQETWASLAGQVILELESAVTVGEHTDLEPQQNLFGDHKVVWEVLLNKPKLF